MSRLRTFVAFTALAAFMCLGIGTATATVASNSYRSAVDLYY